MPDQNQNDPKHKKPSQIPNQPQRKDQQPQGEQPVRRPNQSQQHEDKNKQGKLPDENEIDQGDDEVTGRQPRPEVP
jgi:hypothetical protein